MTAATPEWTVNTQVPMGTMTIALIGDDAARHDEVVRRAGYRTLIARTGQEASLLFNAGHAVDVVVLDFAIRGRPPEAILLFARDVLATSPLLALVPATLDEAYRRAFLAGARDVLPSPCRSEDLLDAIDMALEPKVLTALLEAARAGTAGTEELVPLATTGPLGPGAADVEALKAELDALRAAGARRHAESEGEARLRDEKRQLMARLSDAEAQAAAAAEQTAALRRELQAAREERLAVQRAHASLKRSTGPAPIAQSEAPLDLGFDAAGAAELAHLQDAHAEALSTLEEAWNDNDKLRHAKQELERELGEAETRLDELQEVGDQVAQLTAQLHAERVAHASTRRRRDGLELEVKRLEGHLANAGAVEDVPLVDAVLIEGAEVTHPGPVQSALPVPVPAASLRPEPVYIVVDPARDGAAARAEARRRATEKAGR